MLTASIVLFNTDRDELNTVVGCVSDSCVAIIYLIDNSLTDEIREFATGLSSKVVYIQGQGNIGFGAGHNIALRKAIEHGAKYHLVMNPDISFQPQTIEKLAEFMDANQDVGLTMPKVLYPNGEIQHLCKLLPTPSDWILRRFCPVKSIFQKQNERFELRASGYNKIMNIPYLSGCFMMLKVNVLKEIGLFDEKIFMYGEDTDITRRIHHKYRTVFYPNTVIIHKHNKESYRNYRLLWIHIKAAIYYFNKWGWFFDRERRRINRKVLAELT
jgi:GT2 family glycosyltransferase